MGVSRFSALGLDVQVFSGATNYKAIPKNAGIAMLTKSTAGTDYTLATPAAGSAQAGGNDGLYISIKSTTAAAHVVTCGAGLINGATNGKITLGGAIGDGAVLIAYNGIWYVESSINATVS